MSRTNIFFCLCGASIQRAKDEPSNYPPKWHQKEGQVAIKGIRCNQCRSWWTFTPSRDGPFVEVVQCCHEWQCKCDWTWYSSPEEIQANLVFALDLLRAGEEE